MSSDPLREYYLDLKNLYETGQEEVEEMLNSFWKSYQLFDQLDEALEILGIEKAGQGVDLELARRKYRELALVNHPDRGGDGEEMSKLNWAISVINGGRLGKKI